MKVVIFFVHFTPCVAYNQRTSAGPDPGRRFYVYSEILNWYNTITYVDISPRTCMQKSLQSR